MNYFVGNQNDDDIPGYDRRYPALKRRGGAGIIDFHEDDPEEEEVIQYCKHCLEAGFQVKLGPKILMPNEKRGEDYESWLQCDQCYSIYPVYEIEKQKKLQVGELKGHVVENPFDANETLESVPKRTTAAGIKVRKKRNRPTHKDKEIDREIQQHGSENVHVLEDTDP